MPTLGVALAGVIAETARTRAVFAAGAALSAALVLPFYVVVTDRDPASLTGTRPATDGLSRPRRISRRV